MARHTAQGMPHAGTAGATSGLPGSRTAPFATAFSARALRGEAMVKLKIAYNEVNEHHQRGYVTKIEEIWRGPRLSCPI
jgi:hypothetical protein